MFSRKFVFLFTGFGFAVFTVYLAFFRHPPAAEILAANTGKNSKKQTIAKIHEPGDPDYDPYEEAEKSWENFIVVNGYVSIGELYDRCDVSDRFMVGKVILEPDTLFGGVTSRMFVNVSIEEEIPDGTFYIQVQYNGQDIYENHFQLCRSDRPKSRRIVECPIHEGYQTFDKFIKVPNYIPKGHYTAKGWATDLQGKTLICGFADFVL